MNNQRAAIAALAGILFFYFLLRPEICTTTLFIISAFWIASMGYDLKVTFSNESLIRRYEQSFVLTFLYARFSKITTALLVIFVEIACVMLLPVIFLFEMNLGNSMAVAYFFSILHAMAIIQNEDFTQHLKSKC